MEQVEQIMDAALRARDQNKGGLYFIRCSGPTADAHAIKKFSSVIEYGGKLTWHVTSCTSHDTFVELVTTANRRTNGVDDVFLIHDLPAFTAEGEDTPFYKGWRSLLPGLKKDNHARLIILINQHMVPRMVRYMDDFWKAKDHYVAWPVSKRDKEQQLAREEKARMDRTGGRPSSRKPASKAESTELEKAKLIMRQALVLSTEGQLEEARKAAIKAARVFKENSEMREMALAYELLGGLAERRGDVTEARAWLRAAVETWRGAGDDNKTAECFGKLGHLSYLCGDRERASRQFQSALEIDDALGNKPKVSAGLRRLGLISEEQGEYARAAEMYRESAEVVEAIGDKPGLSRAFHHLGRLHERSGDYQEALKWHNKSRELKEGLNDRLGLATTYHHLGNCYFLMGTYDDAHEFYDRAVELENEFKDFFGKASTLKQLGEVAMAQREWNEALRYFLNAFELWNAFGSPLKASVVGHLGQLRSLVDPEELETAEKEAAEAAKQALIEGDRGMATK